MIDEKVRTEITKINDALDNYSRGRYSKDKAEEVILSSAKEVITSVGRKTSETGGEVFSRKRGSTSSDGKIKSITKGT